MSLVVDNAFWPAAEGMPPTIGSSNKAKAVSRFIDIIYTLLVRKEMLGAILTVMKAISRAVFTVQAPCGDRSPLIYLTQEPPQLLSI
jgi:hypothetical protein